MQISFQGFGSTRTLSGFSLQVENNSSVAQIRQALLNAIRGQEQYLGLEEILIATAFASESQIFDDNHIISQNMVINLLPPVCGG